MNLVEAVQKTPFAYYASFKETELTKFLREAPQKIKGFFCGNRGGKTSSVARHYFERAMGIHPIAEFNRLAVKIRCMSSSLPKSADYDTQDCPQYIELKKLFPKELIVSDVNSREQNLVIRRPPGLSSEFAVFEFRSSKQELQDLGGIPVSSVWHDEETPRGHREECRARLIDWNGDEIFTLTASNALTYVYDDVFQRADILYRTKAFVDYSGLPAIEKRNSKNDIACIQSATDDNPILDKETIDRIFSQFPEEEIPMRRYGIFKQMSGRIHKEYDPAICYRDMKKTFPDGIPYNWIHARGIDYHESRIPWSVGWLSCSPENEWFLWQEFHPAIDGPNSYNTYEIVTAMARKSGDYEFAVNLIDPLANKKQSNTLFSTTDDINRHFGEIRRDSGLGRPTYFIGWDTKGTTGRNEVRARFKNAVRCGRPFNNTIKEKGKVIKLPTLWVMNTCPKFHNSIMNWRYGEHVTSAVKAVNDPKASPQPKFSHDNMVLECLAKDARLLHAASLIRNPPRQEARRHAWGVTGG